MANEVSNFQFELSTGMLYTDQAHVDQVEAGDAPLNLIQLRELGRLAVYDPLEATVPTSETADTIVPLHELLLSPRYADLERSNTYERLDVSQWSKRDYVTYGQWLDSQTKDPQKVKSQLDKHVIERAYHAGIGPGLHRIQRKDHFSSLTDFYRALAIVPGREKHPYDKLSDQQLADWGETVLLGLLSRKQGRGGPSLSEEIARRARRGEGPGLRAYAIQGRSLMRIMALNGYVDPRVMTHEDYIQLGVKIKRANDARELTTKAIAFLARSRRAPTVRSVLGKFPWAKYVERVESSFEAQELGIFGPALPPLEEKEYEDVSPEGSLIARSSAPEDPVRKAKLLLVCSLLPQLDIAKKEIIAEHMREQTLKGLIGVLGEVNDDDIDYAAARLGVAKILWPSQRSYMDYLRVPEELLK